MRMFPLALALTALLCPVRGSSAEEARDIERATATVRGTLPEPSPALAWSFSGDLVAEGDVWAGELDIDVKAHKFGGRSVWKVSETLFVDVGGAELHFKASYHLASDLSLAGGSAESRHRGRTVSVFFGRSKKGLRVIRRTQPPKGEVTSETIEVEVPEDATFGEAAILLFARGLEPADRDTYRMPWAPILQLTMAREASAPGTSVPEVSTLDLVQRGKAKFKSPKQSHAAFAVAASRAALEYTLFLSPDRTQIVGLSGDKPGLFTWVPRGEGGERLTFEEEAPARTWQQAFLKFGFGYHMARRELIEGAFHWPSMYAYETEVAKSWSKDRDEAAFQAAWVDEFVANSLHRTRGETERLLSMTLGTGKVTQKTKDTVVFAAHANFGGGVQRTYHLKQVDGLWYLWRIDF